MERVLITNPKIQKTQYFAEQTPTSSAPIRYQLKAQLSHRHVVCNFKRILWVPFISDVLGLIATPVWHVWMLILHNQSVENQLRSSNKVLLHNHYSQKEVRSTQLLLKMKSKVIQGLFDLSLGNKLSWIFLKRNNQQWWLTNNCPNLKYHPTSNLRGS